MLYATDSLRPTANKLKPYWPKRIAFLISLVLVNVDERGGVRFALGPDRRNIPIGIAR